MLRQRDTVRSCHPMPSLSDPVGRTKGVIPIEQDDGLFRSEVPCNNRTTPSTPDLSDHVPRHSAWLPVLVIDSMVCRMVGFNREELEVEDCNASEVTRMWLEFLPGRNFPSNLAGGMSVSKRNPMTCMTYLRVRPLLKACFLRAFPVVQALELDPPMALPPTRRVT